MVSLAGAKTKAASQWPPVSPPPDFIATGPP